MANSYCVILVRRDIDRFGHNDLFAEEIAAAFREKGWRTKTLDYVAQSRETFDALKDKACRFFLTFNGFGTELLMPTATPGQLQSAYEVFGRPVFDFMHDCPLHETLAHQLKSLGATRRLLSTDVDYAWFAKMLGVRNVVPVPTITFPHAASMKPERRDIDVLFPVGLSSPDISRNRLGDLTSKGRIFRSIFDEVADRCVNNWVANPITELMLLMRDVGLTADPQDEDFRFLLSVVLDHVKFARRHRMLDALKDVPLTLVTDRDVPSLARNVTVVPARSAKELLALMGRSKVVVCPPVHALGFHERPFMAFTAGAVVLSAPNGPLEASFAHGDEILFFRDAQSLRERAKEAVGCPEIGERGREKALRQFHPERLVDTILNDQAVRS